MASKLLSMLRMTDTSQDPKVVPSFESSRDRVTRKSPSAPQLKMQGESMEDDERPSLTRNSEELKLNI